MPSDPNGRYQSETTSSGTTVCRDQETGQFADKTNCAARTVYAVNAEMLGGVPAGSGLFGLGAGVRGGNSSGPYFIAAYVFSQHPQNAWQLRARIGRRVADFSIGGSIVARAR